MRALAVAMALCFGATAATAQTHTTCRQSPSGGVLECRSTGPDDLADVKAAPCSKGERLLLGSDQCARRDKAARSKRVAELIALRRCDEALSVALSAADLAQAGQVREICKAN